METKEKNKKKKSEINNDKKETNKDNLNEENSKEVNTPNDEFTYSNENDERQLLSNRIKELEDNLLRSQAELINYKRRKDEEVNRIIKYSEENILKGFLPILDNFERAIKLDDANLNDELSKFLSGFKMIYTHLVETLKKFEVKEIECLDKTFDHNTCQALMTCKVEGIEPGIVVEVLQKGYMLKDKMIRPALVKVSE